MTHLALLYRAGELYRDQLAVVSGHHRLTYAQLVRDCERCAAWLQGVGVKRGDTVPFTGPNHLAFLLHYFGPSMIGAVAEMLHGRQHPPSPEPELPAGRIARPDLATVSDDQPTAIFHTSGTEGAPKQVVLTHANLYRHALALSAVCPDRTAAVELQCVPLYHANGWGRIHLSLLHGNMLVLLPRWDPAEAGHLIERERVTHTALVPTMAIDLLAHCDHFDPGSLREMHLGGALPDRSLVDELRRAFDCQVTVGYGMTEANSAIAYDGRLLPGLEAKIADDEEILLRGETMATGPNWFATGDLGTITAGGLLEITGRKKDVIISGGEIIWPAEIERALHTHSQVVECAVVAAPHPRWGETPVALVVPRTPTVTCAELELYLGQRLPRYKLPSRIILRLAPLPRTPSGKIAKHALIPR